MFDTIAGKLVGGAYLPKDPSRTAWETHTREYTDFRTQMRQTSVRHVLNRPEARIAIQSDGAILRVESSLPKLVFGNNLSTISRPERALHRLQEFVADHVEGPLPNLAEMQFLRVDYCHNFNVGPLLADYVATLSKIPFLKHRCTTDGYDGVEWYGDNGRRGRAYDKFQEILEKDKKEMPSARGILRFELEIRKKAQFIQRRLKKQRPTLADVLDPPLGYSILAETLNQMCIDFKFVPQDSARQILDAHFSSRKATALLGLLRRLQTQPMEDLKYYFPRSTFYSAKRDLRRFGLWPPAMGDAELPGLQLPPLEQCLENHVVQQ